MIDLTCVRCGGKLTEKPYASSFLKGIELECGGCGRRFIELEKGVPSGNKYSVVIANGSGIAIGNSASVVVVNQTIETSNEKATALQIGTLGRYPSKPARDFRGRFKKDKDGNLI